MKIKDMPLSFTLKALIAKMPCEKEFTRLMEHMSIAFDVKELNKRLTPAFGCEYVYLLAPTASDIFTQEQLDTVITAYDVVKATNRDGHAYSNLCWCSINNLFDPDPSAEQLKTIVARTESCLLQFVLVLDQQPL